MMHSKGGFTRNTKLKDKYSTHRTGIDEDISSLVISLLNYDIKTSYAASGCTISTD